MAQQINRLTTKQIETIRTPGRHADGQNLFLSISDNGGRRWVFLYRWKGGRIELGLGSAREVGLAAARELAREARNHLREGRDPRLARAEPTFELSETPARPTFQSVADDLIAVMTPSWRNDKHAAQWTATLKTHAANLWVMPVDQIETDHVLRALQPIWSAKPETASRVRGRIERVLSAAKAKGLRYGENPAQWRGHLDQLLPKPKKLSRGHGPTV